SRAVGPGGHVAGIDPSAEMIRQSAARNGAGVASGRVDLRRASAAALPYPDGSIDAVYASNSAQFWPDLADGVRQIARVLVPGGRALIAVQPMRRGATEADSNAWAERLRGALVASEAFDAIAVHVRKMAPAPAVAVAAVRRA